jgi:hypothetical protein
MTTIAGRLGTPQILATTDLTEIYEIGAGFFGIVNVSITNRTDSDLSIKLATSDSSTPEPAEYIEWNTVIIPRGVLERTGIILQAGRKILVSCDTLDSVAVTVYGILTDTLVPSVEQGDPIDPVNTTVEFTVISSEWFILGFSTGTSLIFETDTPSSKAILDELSNTISENDTVELYLNDVLITTQTLFEADPVRDSGGIFIYELKTVNDWNDWSTVRPGGALNGDVIKFVVV